MALSLSSALIQLAAERGYHRLFIYTKPEKRGAFSGCGFYPIATVPERVVLLENSPVRLKQYQQQLSALKKAGSAHRLRIVLNANPFTLGHLYLIETALQQCDWLHVFVVGEDRFAIFLCRPARAGARRHGSIFPASPFTRARLYLSRAPLSLAIS